MIKVAVVARICIGVILLFLMIEMFEMFKEQKTIEYFLEIVIFELSPVFLVYIAIVYFDNFHNEYHTLDLN